MVNQKISDKHIRISTGLTGGHTHVQLAMGMCAQVLTLIVMSGVS